MASKHLMSYKIQMNFDFGKLTTGGKMGEHVDKLLGKHGKALVKMTRDNLESGNFRQLKESTLKSRKIGRKRFNEAKDPKKTTSTKPLHHTGALLESIMEKSVSADNIGMQMLEYGKLQHNGWNSSGTYKGFVHGRKFIPQKTRWDKKKKIEIDGFTPEFKKIINTNNKVFINQITKMIRTPLK